MPLLFILRPKKKEDVGQAPISPDALPFLCVEVKGEEAH